MGDPRPQSASSPSDAGERDQRAGEQARRRVAPVDAMRARPGSRRRAAARRRSSHSAGRPSTVTVPAGRGGRRRPPRTPRSRRCSDRSMSPSCQRADRARPRLVRRWTGRAAAAQHDRAARQPGTARRAGTAAPARRRHPPPTASRASPTRPARPAAGRAPSCRADRARRACADRSSVDGRIASAMP